MSDLIESNTVWGTFILGPTQSRGHGLTPWHQPVVAYIVLPWSQCTLSAYIVKTYNHKNNLGWLIQQKRLPPYVDLQGQEVLTKYWHRVSVCRPSRDLKQASNMGCITSLSVKSPYNNYQAISGLQIANVVRNECKTRPNCEGLQ